MDSGSEGLVHLVNGWLAVHGRADRYRLRTAVHGDVAALVMCMGQADRRELEAASALDIPDALHRGLSLSQGSAWTMDMRRDGGWKAQLLLGVAQDERWPGLGVPWMVASDVPRKDARMMLGLGRVVAAYLSRHWPVLFNMVHAKNRKALNWLGRIGFSVCPVTMCHGPSGEAFHAFIQKEKEHV